MNLIQSSLPCPASLHRGPHAGSVPRSPLPPQCRTAGSHGLSTLRCGYNHNTPASPQISTIRRIYAEHQVAAWLATWRHATGRAGLSRQSATSRRKTATKPQAQITCSACMAGIQLEPLEAEAEAAEESPMLQQRAARVTMRRCVMLSKKDATRQASTFVGNAGNTTGSSTRSAHCVSDNVCDHVNNLLCRQCQEPVRAKPLLAMTNSCLSLH